MGLRGRDAPKCQLADECREAGRAARVFRMSPPECPTRGSVQGLCRPGARERWGPRGPVSVLCGAQRAGARAWLRRAAGEPGQAGSAQAWKGPGGPSGAVAPGAPGCPPSSHPGQHHRGAATRPYNLPPAALSLSLPERQSGPLWSRPGCQLGHARYKTRGPPWVPGWGRGHLHGSMSVILTRAPPGPAGKRLSAPCGGGSREGACPRKEHFTSVLRLPKVLPSLVVLPLLLEGLPSLLVLPLLLPWFSPLPPQMPRSPASGPPFSASLRTAAPVLICLSLWSLGERDLCWTKPPVPAPRTRQTPTGKFRGSQGGSHSKKPLGSEPSGFGSPPASPPCWPCGLLAFKPGRLLFLE